MHVLGCMQAANLMCLTLDAQLKAAQQETQVVRAACQADVQQAAAAQAAALAQSQAQMAEARLFTPFQSHHHCTSLSSASCNLCLYSSTKPMCAR